VGWSSGAGHRGCGPRGADSWQIDNRLDLTCSSMDLARLRAWRSPTPWRSPTAAEVELGGCGLLPAAAACSHEIRQPPPWAALCVCPSVRPSVPPSFLGMAREQRRRVGRDAAKREGSQECGCTGRSPQNAATDAAIARAATVHFGSSICRCSARCGGRWSWSQGRIHPNFFISILQKYMVR
jgi:hypothetical protein